MTAIALAGPPLRDWQREAFEAWVAADRSAVVEAVTGTGKTTLGIAAAADAIARDMNVLVVVPGIELLDQWYRAIRRVLPDIPIGRRGGGFTDTFRGNRILVSTVQSAISRSAPRAVRSTLLVADEVHRYGALTFSRLLTDSFVERIGLTATFERSDDGVERHLLPYFRTVIDGCDYKRGHADGILAPVRVMLVAVPFDEIEAAEYQEYDEVARQLRGDLIEKFGCAGEPFGDFMRDVQLLSGGESAESATWVARKYLYAFSKRRALLAECRGKLEALRDLGSVLKESGRALTFSETKDSSRAAAEVLLQEGVLAAPFTSDLSRSDRARLLTEFKNGRLTTLVAPKVLDEGVDVPEADVGIILASSKSRRQMIQRMGRIIRPKSDGRPASFLVMFAANSSEDPSNGAHGTFLDQLTGIASEVVTVGPDEAPDLLRKWMRAESDAVDETSPPTEPPHASESGTEAVPVDEVVTIAQRLIEDDAPEDDFGSGSENAEIGRVLLAVGEYGTDDDFDIVLACLSILEPRQVSVLVMRYGLDGQQPRRQAKVGARLGISARQVNRIERTAIEYLGDTVARELLSDVMARMESA
ncbi:DEAD/DEAH box helicase family protein [Rhodococcus sp. Z13]|uniref:DEAD/DEAH box helicase family protein n=1 Tax=Rhodococcus sacchari TaxID=2962047 RepID=A0ACD4DJP4_9NOCA|nr:DEAD/DEAH box helicase family protein [Rhodococcus sp. Z13]UYP20191.1 DEAD/DEAH box helicase family protein [Rhodococcus sp. Z13]